MARHVLLLTHENATVNAVADALQSNGKLASDDVCSDVGQVVRRLEQGRCPAVLVDIDADPQHSLAVVESLSRRFGETRFIVLSNTMHHALLLDAMKAGARHFLQKDAIGAELGGVLKHLCPEEPETRGSIVTLLSAGGGCGATTAAVNLAAELQLLDGESDMSPALVVDLDTHYGAVAAYLGLESKYGLSDLFPRPDAIDAHLIQSTAMSHSQKLHALLGVPRDRLGETNEIDPRRIGNAIEACKAAYRWTVIDAPRVSPAVASELVRHSTATLLLLQLSVKDIRVARRMLQNLGAPPQSLYVLAARYRKRRLLIDPIEARKALGMPEGQRLEFLNNDYYAVTNAVNLGKTLSETAPKSEFRRDLQRLAGVIAGSTGSSADRKTGKMLIGAGRNGG